MKRFAVKALCGLSVLFAMNAHSALNYWHIKENNSDEYTYNIVTPRPNFFEITIKCYPNGLDKPVISFGYRGEASNTVVEKPLTNDVEYTFVVDNLTVKPQANDVFKMMFINKIGNAQMFAVVDKDDEIVAFFTPFNKAPNLAKNCTMIKE
ncbi:hypothetical protein LP090_05085 [Moraxella bovis]|uniref:hypothetical protein n=1 Tax=Moraxella bovis TaxID=476 RepID=UPI002225EFA4|nr:hypothetical protein [Moraxella bovis]UYZ67637.1 hypothetical protein LP122_07520 [Moraxella bovis]UYZ70011.1 hypothetical protein LP089_07610 [Moraxella bovis]UYZ74075.1 hypothetical protein LP105_05095 [Moraxella bovis]UZA13302.1 hypothetical protein LP102_07625 [Moraxella bovis]UZA28345.1 hypothetical protein LP119_05160 [Moraxella bovis]